MLGTLRSKLALLSAFIGLGQRSQEPVINPAAYREPAPAMIRSNRPQRREPSSEWLAQWCADNVGRGFAAPIFEPLPSPFFWKRDMLGEAWRIYRVPA